jgi:hypothetical protein
MAEGIKASEWLRGIGWVLIAVGIACFPFGLGASPKRDLNTFNNLADLGLFWKTGIGLIVMGIVCLIASSVSWRKSQ